jgi:CubicO group peptidase (beta-lactamase class C family)
MKSNTVMLIGVILCLLASGSSADSARDTLERKLQATVSGYLVPSMAIALVGPDTIYYTGAIGLRYKDKADSVTVNDKYHIGSLTKSFTALLAARLHDKGHLDLNTPLSIFWPDSSASIHTDYENVTFTDLLNHTAGLSAAPHGIQFNDTGFNSVIALRSAYALSQLSNPPENSPPRRLSLFKCRVCHCRRHTRVFGR